MTDDTKRCSKCGETKPITGFSPRGAGRPGHQAWCKRCLSAYSTARAAAKVRERMGLPLETPSMRGFNGRKRPEGATIVEKAGYVLEKRTGHHRADGYGWVFQHILVAEAKYGFPITRAFTIHHRNADRADNRPENLELRIGNHGKGGDAMAVLLRDPELRAQAVEILRGYGHEVAA